MATWVWVVIAVAVVAVIVLIAIGASKQRTARLRDRFGPEYDRAVADHDGRRAGEAELRGRQKQRARFDVKPLPEAARLRFAGEWREVQERFVDQPEQAAAAADTLIAQVMEARGYPINDFDAQADLVSVDHPETVENYRFAHAVQQRSQIHEASTEDLREALLRYRSLFGELLSPEGNGVTGATSSQARPAADGSRQSVPAEDEPAGQGTGAAEQTEGPGAMEEDDSSGLAGPDPEYHEQIGRRGNR